MRKRGSSATIAQSLWISWTTEGGLPRAGADGAWDWGATRRGSAGTFDGPLHQQVGNQPMPEISRFFGIIIRMFMEVGAPHHRPHFHAAYQNAKGVFALDPVECIGGDLPRTQQRLVEAWAEIHLEELLQDWNLLQSGQPPLKIEPLR